MTTAPASSAVAMPGACAAYALRNVAPLGYPEIDFDGAKVEARFIRLFEQARSSGRT